MKFESLTVSGQSVDIVVDLNEKNEIVKIVPSQKDKNGNPFEPSPDDMALFEVYATMHLSAASTNLSS
jgi:hypothetical protein